jgi:hypothetical protein
VQVARWASCEILFKSVALARAYLVTVTVQASEILQWGRRSEMRWVTAAKWMKLWIKRLCIWQSEAEKTPILDLRDAPESREYQPVRMQVL